MIMTRISTIVKAYINEGLERLEDPVLMVKQYMRDIKTEIDQLEETIKKQESFERKLDSQLVEAKELFQRREEQANMAIEAGHDDLARKILLSKKGVWEQVIQYEQLLNKNREKIKEKNTELEKWQSKYDQVKENKDDLSVRIKGVKARKQMDKYEKENIWKADKEDEDLLEKEKLNLEIENELNALKEKK